MKTVGLIVEYNPLHNGHVYHYEQSKLASGADSTVAVMSGHFLQRGEPAVVNKWARTEMALRMGADLVLELPVAYSSQPAEWFAYGAVAVLESTGLIDSICFGSESGDIKRLDKVAAHMADESGPFRSLLQERLGTGVPYPTAYSEAVARYVPDTPADMLAQPNNTLGLHYLIALRRLGSRMKPLTISRTKAGYNELAIRDERIASATSLRRILFEERRLDGIKPYVPESTYEVLRREWDAGHAPIGWSHYTKQLLHQLLSRSLQELSDCYEVAEGLEYRIKRVLPGVPFTDGPNVSVFEELLSALKTKRYTRTKLQRMLLRIMLGHRKDQLSPEKLRGGPGYIRVLGFTDKGRKLLHTMKHTATAPIMTKVTDSGNPFLQMDLQATSLYALGYSAPHPHDAFRDYYMAPVRI